MLRELSRMWHLICYPGRDMPLFLEHPPAVHATFARSVVPAVGVRSAAILVRSWAQGAWAAGVIMAVAAVALQLLSWACFGWLLVLLTRLGHLHLTERQAFALSTAVSVPLWLGGVFYLLPEEPPALFVLGRLAVLACGAWGVVMLAHARWTHAPSPRRRHALVLAGGVGYSAIYALFWAAIGLLTTLVTFVWST
jgi:hypothetical protein